MYLLSLLDPAVIMLNKRLAYLRSSHSCPINLSAAERMHEVGEPCAFGSNYELINHLFDELLEILQLELECVSS